MSEEKPKKEIILEAAAVIFAQHGFHNAKVEEIAQKAGVGKGTVYEYFSSKQQLFQQLFIHWMGKLLDAIAAELTASTDAKQKIIKMAHLHCEHILQSRDLTRITMDGYNQLDASFRQWLQKAQTQKLDMIEQAIKEGMSTGEFRADLNSRAAALAFSGAMTTTIHIALFTEQITKVELLKQVGEIVEIIIKGIEA